MMPFFALIMLEGRMLNEIKDIEEAEDLNRIDNRLLPFARSIKPLSRIFNHISTALTPL